MLSRQPAIALNAAISFGRSGRSRQALKARLVVFAPDDESGRLVGAKAGLPLRAEPNVGAVVTKKD
jgi:hypothetical protein